MNENNLPVAIAMGLLASVPVAGPVAVEVVSLQLQKKQQERIDELHRVLSELVARTDAFHRPSENLQSRVMENSLASGEAWQLHAYAKLLLEAKESIPDLRRIILLDFVSELRVYDIWILLNIEGDNEKLKRVPSSIADAIYDLEESDPNVSELRPYSLNKLTSMGLASTSNKSGSYVLQPLGRDLLEFI